MSGLYIDVNYDDYVRANRDRLRAALVAAYGADLGVEATAEALAYGWENWHRLQKMENPTGYLYRVGQTSVRSAVKQQGYLPAIARGEMPQFEPELAPALERLPETQRVSIVLVHALGWPLADAAAVLNVSVSTLRTHIARGMTKLRNSLKVDLHVS